MDELLYRLRLSGFGCHVGNISIPAIGYADDVALLALLFLVYNYQRFL